LRRNHPDSPVPDGTARLRIVTSFTRERRRGEWIDVTKNVTTITRFAKPR
jgi:hypothetical protein